MLRVGVRFERLFAEERKNLQGYITRLLRKNDWVARPNPMDSEADSQERRVEPRVVLRTKGDLVAFIANLDGQLPQIPMGATPSDPRKKTGELRTYNILDISLEGCSFFASDDNTFKPHMPLTLKVVGEGLMLDAPSRVIHLVRLSTTV